MDISKEEAKNVLGSTFRYSMDYVMDGGLRLSY